ncbi:MAG: vWA domain-containing protein [Planctomycetaceae bacterium]
MVRIRPQSAGFTSPRPGGAGGQGLLTSTLLHAAALASLSLLYLPGSTGPAHGRLATIVTTQAEPLDRTEFEAMLPAAVESASLSSGGNVSAALVPAELSRTELRPEFRLTAAPAVPLLEEDLRLTEGVRIGASAVGRGQGDGSGDGTGAGRGAGGRRFFAPTAGASRFVFVVDSSQSMNHTWPGPAKSRLGRVKVELWRSIFSMANTQRYAIIFFNSGAVPMPGLELREGGPEGQQDLFNWTAGIRAEGKTDPQEALLLALQLRPDVIYFLTDGEFNYRVVRRVAEVNTGGVTIHTVSLGDRAAERFLKEIATTSGGEYRHIEAVGDHYWDETAGDASVGGLR